MVAAAQAKAEHVRVYTIAFGTPNGVVSAGAFGQIVRVPPDPTALQRRGEGHGRRVLHRRRRRHAEARLQEHRKPGRHDDQHQDVSYAFAGVGAVLLAAAGLLSTLWRSQVA